MKDYQLLKSKLKQTDAEFAQRIQDMPPRDETHLPPYWLHLEMIERYRILLDAGIRKGWNVLEIGCGHHAISTVPISNMVGSGGRVVAIDIDRWGCFEEIIQATGFNDRVIPISCDATSLPFQYRCFDLGVVIHGIRSMRSKDNIVRIIKELLRVSSQIFISS